MTKYKWDTATGTTVVSATDGIEIPGTEAGFIELLNAKIISFTNASTTDEVEKSNLANDIFILANHSPELAQQATFTYVQDQSVNGTARWKTARIIANATEMALKLYENTDKTKNPVTPPAPDNKLARIDLNEEQKQYFEFKQEQFNNGDYEYTDADISLYRNLFADFKAKENNFETVSIARNIKSSPEAWASDQNLLRQIKSGLEKPADPDIRCFIINEEGRHHWTGMMVDLRDKANPHFYYMDSIGTMAPANDPEYPDFNKRDRGLLAAMKQTLGEIPAYAGAAQALQSRSRDLGVGDQQLYYRQYDSTSCGALAPENLLMAMKIAESLQPGTPLTAQALRTANENLFPRGIIPVHLESYKENGSLATMIQSDAAPIRSAQASQLRAVMESGYAANAITSYNLDLIMGSDEAYQEHIEGQAIEASSPAALASSSSTPATTAGAASGAAEAARALKDATKQQAEDNEKAAAEIRVQLEKADKAGNGSTEANRALVSLCEANPDAALVVGKEDNRLVVALCAFSINEVQDKMVVKLIEGNAKLDGKGGDNYTPLHYAAARGKQSIANAIIAKDNGQLSAQTTTGAIPLHLAAFHAPTQMWELLAKGSSLTALNSMQRSPLDELFPDPSSKALNSAEIKQRLTILVGAVGSGNVSKDNIAYATQAYEQQFKTLTKDEQQAFTDLDKKDFKNGGGHYIETLKLLKQFGLTIGRREVSTNVDRSVQSQPVAAASASPIPAALTSQPTAIRPIAAAAAGSATPGTAVLRSGITAPELAPNPSSAALGLTPKVSEWLEATKPFLQEAKLSVQAIIKASSANPDNAALVMACNVINANLEKLISPGNLNNATLLETQQALLNSVETMEGNASHIDKELLRPISILVGPMQATNDLISQPSQPLSVGPSASAASATAATTTATSGATLASATGEVSPHTFELLAATKPFFQKAQLSVQAIIKASSANPDNAALVMACNVINANLEKLISPGNLNNATLLETQQALLNSVETMEGNASHIDKELLRPISILVGPMQATNDLISQPSQPLSAGPSASAASATAAQPVAAASAAAAQPNSAVANATATAAPGAAVFRTTSTAAPAPQAAQAIAANASQQKARVGDEETIQAAIAADKKLEVDANISAAKNLGALNAAIEAVANDATMPVTVQQAIQRAQQLLADHASNQPIDSQRFAQVIGALSKVAEELKDSQNLEQRTLLASLKDQMLQTIPPPPAQQVAQTPQTPSGPQVPNNGPKAGPNLNPGSPPPSNLGANNTLVPRAPRETPVGFAAGAVHDRLNPECRGLVLEGRAKVLDKTQGDTLTAGIRVAVKSVLDDASIDKIAPIPEPGGKFVYNLLPSGKLTLALQNDGTYKIAENTLAPGQFFSISLPRMDALGNDLPGEYDVVTFCKDDGRNGGIANVVSTTGGRCVMHAEVVTGPAAGLFALKDYELAAPARAVAGQAQGTSTPAAGASVTPGGLGQGTGTGGQTPLAGQVPASNNPTGLSEPGQGNGNNGTQPVPGGQPPLTAKPVPSSTARNLTSRESQPGDALEEARGVEGAAPGAPRMGGVGSIVDQGLIVGDLLTALESKSSKEFMQYFAKRQKESIERLAGEPELQEYLAQAIAIGEAVINLHNSLYSASASQTIQEPTKINKISEMLKTSFAGDLQANMGKEEILEYLTQIENGAEGLTQVAAKSSAPPPPPPPPPPGSGQGYVRSTTTGSVAEAKGTILAELKAKGYKERIIGDYTPASTDPYANMDQKTADKMRNLLRKQQVAELVAGGNGQNKVEARKKRNQDGMAGANYFLKIVEELGRSNGNKGQVIATQITELLATEAKLSKAVAERSQKETAAKGDLDQAQKKLDAFKLQNPKKESKLSSEHAEVVQKAAALKQFRDARTDAVRSHKQVAELLISAHVLVKNTSLTANEDLQTRVTLLSTMYPYVTVAVEHQLAAINAADKAKDGVKLNASLTDLIATESKLSAMIADQAPLKATQQKVDTLEAEVADLKSSLAQTDSASEVKTPALRAKEKDLVAKQDELRLAKVQLSELIHGVEELKWSHEDVVAVIKQAKTIADKNPEPNLSEVKERLAIVTLIAREEELRTKLTDHALVSNVHATIRIAEENLQAAETELNAHEAKDFRKERLKSVRDSAALTVTNTKTELSKLEKEKAEYQGLTEKADKLVASNGKADATLLARLQASKESVVRSLDDVQNPKALPVAAKPAASVAPAPSPAAPAAAASAAAPASAPSASTAKAAPTAASSASTSASAAPEAASVVQPTSAATSAPAPSPAAIPAAAPAASDAAPSAAAPKASASAPKQPTAPAAAVPATTAAQPAAADKPAQTPGTLLSDIADPVKRQLRKVETSMDRSAPFIEGVKPIPAPAAAATAASAPAPGAAATPAPIVSDAPTAPAPSVAPASSASAAASAGTVAGASKKALPTRPNPSASAPPAAAVPAAAVPTGDVKPAIPAAAAKPSNALGITKIGQLKIQMNAICQGDSEDDPVGRAGTILDEFNKAAEPEAIDLNQALTNLLKNGKKEGGLLDEVQKQLFDLLYNHATNLGDKGRAADVHETVQGLLAGKPGLLEQLQPTINGAPPCSAAAFEPPKATRGRAMSLDTARGIGEAMGASKFGDAYSPEEKDASGTLSTVPTGTPPAARPTRTGGRSTTS